MTDRLPSLIAATKLLSSKPTWVKSGDQINLVTALEIDGATVMGLRFRIRCSREYSNRNVTFQIEFLFKGFKLVPVTRLDWRPFNLHQNSNIGPAEWRLCRLPGSHLHGFQDNFDWMMASGLSAPDFAEKNLPIAVPLDTEPATFEGVAVEAGRLFNIQGLAAVPAPPWEPRLL